MTQNVDGLHGEYPNEQLVEIHGRLGMLKCISEGGYVNESIKRMRPFWAILLSTCWLASPIVIVSFPLVCACDPTSGACPVDTHLNDSATGDRLKSN